MHATRDFAFRSYALTDTIRDAPSAYLSGVSTSSGSSVERVPSEAYHLLPTFLRIFGVSSGTNPLIFAGPIGLLTNQFPGLS